MENDSLLYLISGLGTFNGFIFGIYLFFSQLGNKRTNIYLGIFLILISIRFFRSIHFHFYGPDHTIFHIGHTAFLIAIPFIYFYFRASFTRNKRLKRTDFIHLLPLLILTIHSFNVLNMVSFSVLIFYTLLSYRILHKFQSKNNEINLKAYNYYWYRNLLFILLINSILYLLNLTLHLMPYILGAISYSIIFYIMMFYWNRYQQTQKQRKILRKYNGSGLSIEEAKTYIDQLFEKITKDDLYKDPFLDLKKLAELLSIPYYQLSQIINQHLGKNFTEFINEYRVNEAKRLLKNPANINETIENIAYDSGFNNPSSFYAAFKKIAQTTPTKYKKEQLKLP